MDSLGYILEGKTMAVAKNELVLVVPTDGDIDSIPFNASVDWTTILQGGLLSIGDPAFVPVGNYAQQSLAYYQHYQQLEDQLAKARDVRSTLWIVELKEARAGIVFRSEAKHSTKVKTIALIPSESHKPITFLASQCKNTPQADLFYHYLNTPQARHIWIKHGFY